jgi:hypothetical protein
MKQTIFRIFLVLLLLLAAGLILLLALRGGQTEPPTLVSPALTAQLNQLRDSVHPGTAGSSLRAAAVAADLLDWAEEPIPQESIDATVAEWLAAQSEEARELLPLQAEALLHTVEELSESYEEAAGLRSDAGLEGRGPWSREAAEQAAALLAQLKQ